MPTTYFYYDGIMKWNLAREDEFFFFCFCLVRRGIASSIRTENPFGWFFDRKIVVPSDISRGRYRSQGISGWTRVLSDTGCRRERDSKMWRVIPAYIPTEKPRPALFSSLALLPFFSFDVLILISFFFLIFSLVRIERKSRDRVREIDVRANFRFVPETREGERERITFWCVRRVRVFDFRVHFPTAFPWGWTWPDVSHLSSFIWKSIGLYCFFNIFTYDRLSFFLKCRATRYVEIAVAIYLCEQVPKETRGLVDDETC